jgi:hypothetical protein
MSQLSGAFDECVSSSGGRAESRARGGLVPSAWRRAPPLARPLPGERDTPAYFGRIIVTVHKDGELL